MGLLIKRRGKLESIGDTDPILNYSIANIGNNDTTMKVWDNIEIPLAEIRRRIASGPPKTISFIVDNS